jgi:hypothetical protein
MSQALGDENEEDATDPEDIGARTKTTIEAKFLSRPLHPPQGDFLGTAFIKNQLFTSPPAGDVEGD